MFSNLIANTIIFKVLTFIWVQQERVLSFRPPGAVSLAPRRHITHPPVPCHLPPVPCHSSPGAVPLASNMFSASSAFWWHVFCPRCLMVPPGACRWRVFCHQCLVLAGAVFSASFFIFIFFFEFWAFAN